MPLTTTLEGLDFSIFLGRIWISLKSFLFILVLMFNSLTAFFVSVSILGPVTPMILDTLGPAVPGSPAFSAWNSAPSITSNMPTKVSNWGAVANMVPVQLGPMPLMILFVSFCIQQSMCGGIECWSSPKFRWWAKPPVPLKRSRTMTMLGDLKLEEAASEIANFLHVPLENSSIVSFSCIVYFLPAQVVLNHLNLELSGRQIVSLRMDLRGNFIKLYVCNSMDPPALQPFFWEPDTQGAEQNQHSIYTTDAHQLQPVVELPSFLQKSSTKPSTNPQFLLEMGAVNRTRVCVHNCIIYCTNI